MIKNNIRSKVELSSNLTSIEKILLLKKVKEEAKYLEKKEKACKVINRIQAVRIYKADGFVCQVCGKVDLTFIISRCLKE